MSNPDQKLFDFLIGYSQERGFSYVNEKLSEFPDECFDNISESSWLTIFKNKNISETTKTHLWKGLENRGGDVLNIPIPNLLPVSYTLVDALLNASGDFELSKSFVKLLSEPRFIEHYRSSIDRLSSLTKSLLCAEDRFGTIDKLDIFTCLFDLIPKDKDIQNKILQEVLCSHLFISKPDNFLMNALWNNWDFSTYLPMTHSLKKKLDSNPLLQECSQVPAWVFVFEPTLIWENLGERNWSINEKSKDNKSLSWGTILLCDAIKNNSDSAFIRYMEILDFFKYDFTSPIEGMKMYQYVKKNKALDYESRELLFFKKLINEIEIKETLKSKTLSNPKNRF